MAHVRAVRKIVCAVFAAEELKEKGSFVGSTARGVELHHVRIRQATKDLADVTECLIPANRFVRVAGTIVNQRLGQTTLVLQLVIGPFQQVRHFMTGKEFLRYSLLGCFPSNRFRSIFAELEGRGVLLIRPRTTWTVETGRFVGAVQKQRRLQDVHLFAYGTRCSTKRAPATGGTLIGPNSWDFASCRHFSFPHASICRPMNRLPHGRHFDDSNATAATSSIGLRPCFQPISHL